MYTRQSKRLRSCEEAAKWYLEQLSGGFIAPLAEVMARFTDLTSLDEIGFRTSRQELPFNGLHLKHPMVKEEDERARVAGEFGLQLVAARMLRQLMFSQILSNARLE